MSRVFLTVLPRTHSLTPGMPEFTCRCSTMLHRRSPAVTEGTDSGIPGEARLGRATLHRETPRAEKS